MTGNVVENASGDTFEAEPGDPREDVTGRPMRSKSSINWKIKCILGGTMLSRNYYLFLLVHTLFLIFTRIPAIFINTLLMASTLILCAE